MIRNKILQEDIADFSLPTELSDRLRNSTIIVTGSTGLIGSAFVRCLDSLNLGIWFVLPVRNAGKAEALFEGETDSMEIIETGLTEFFEKRDSPCDYIIHCASPTNGKYMCAHPAETFLLPIESIRALLDYSLCQQADRMVNGIVYLSSIEYYGRMAGDAPVREDVQGYIDTKSPRSSYALGKRSAEYLGYCYAEEYGVPFRSARLTQTFGAGIPETDKRVFAQFARSDIEGRDIILHTEGRSTKPYCYTTDCVSALIHILLKVRMAGPITWPLPAPTSRFSSWHTCSGIASIRRLRCGQRFLKIPDMSPKLWLTLTPTAC